MADNKNKNIIDNNLEAFQRFQEATKKGAAARAEILKGIQNDLPYEELLTIATDCIGFLCDNQFFADQVRTNLEKRRERAENPDGTAS